jgi:hypothetical protein
MSKFEISDLSSIGVDLFDDAESFMQDLNQDELAITGGQTFSGKFIDSDNKSTAPILDNNSHPKQQPTAINCTVGSIVPLPHNPHPRPLPLPRPFPTWFDKLH